MPNSSQRGPPGINPGQRQALTLHAYHVPRAPSLAAPAAAEFRSALPKPAKSATNQARLAPQLNHTDGKCDAEVPELRARPFCLAIGAHIHSPIDRRTNVATRLTPTRTPRARSIDFDFFSLSLVERKIAMRPTNTCHGPVHGPKLLSESLPHFWTIQR